jgi:hypothetical protein
VLPLIIALDLVRVRETIKSRVWETLVVVAPGDAFVFKEVDDGRHVLVDDQETVAVGTECVTTGGCHVGGLTWITDAVQVREQDALVDQGLAVGYGSMSDLKGHGKEEVLDVRSAIASS